MDWAFQRRKRNEERAGESDAIATDASLLCHRGKVNFRNLNSFIKNVDSRWDAINVDPSTEPSQHPQVARQQPHRNHLNHH